MYPFEEGVPLFNQSTPGAEIDFSFTGDKMFQSINHSSLISPSTIISGTAGDQNGTAFDSQDISMFFGSNKELVKTGTDINIPIDYQLTGVDWEVNDQIIIEHEYIDSFGETQKATARLQIIDLQVPAESPGWGHQWILTQDPLTLAVTWAQQSETSILATIMSITGNFPIRGILSSDLYNVFLVQKPPIFEVKFPKFSYRYKYEDGEYSVFGPWSEIAFIPGSFDYLPKKGYNLGMENNLRALRIKNWVPKNIPKDVIQVDILYKESNSPNIYTLSSHKEDDPVEGIGSLNYWRKTGTGGNGGDFGLKSELIHKVVASNQMLRPWDNVPRKALAQDITANRLIYANYVQNFNLKDKNGETVKASFIPSIDENDYSIDSLISPMPGSPAKSLKSMRTYQLGVVYRDRYGRETPVLTSKSGSIKLAKINAKLQNRLSVQLTNKPPYWAESYTFYIKETSNEYYNLSMDRWYDAEDGGIWLSFPSSERNKISDRTNLILKKQHDTDIFTDYDTKYKVLSIKDNAPTFIKTDNKYWGSLPMMLPPPGWGTGGKPGNWDAGMFFNTGLPLPNRMFIDIYAEYWDQSSLKELSSKSGAQVRVIQSQGTASSFNATTSDTTNKTLWYDIAKISYIGSPPQTQEVEVPSGSGVSQVTTTTTVEVPGQVEQLVRISLEKAFGNDALFCEPEDNLSLSRGLSIEARTKDVKDKSQFEGRFFVKILRDANVEANIVQPQQQEQDKYQILLSRKLKYINFAQPGIQDWSQNVISKKDGTVEGSIQLNTPNYIPVGINTKDFQDIGINDTLYGTTPGNTDPMLVSSLSEDHSNKGAYYTSIFGGTLEAPDTGKYWPWGPGDATVGAWNHAWWQNKYSSYLVMGSSTQAPMWPPWGADSPPDDSITYTGALLGIPATPIPNLTVEINKPIKDWPSYAVGEWNPYSQIVDENSSTINGGPHAGGINPTTYPGPYSNRIGSNISSHASLKILVGGAFNTFGYIPNSTAHDDNNYLHGANPYQLPAIFGDQTDFQNNSTNPHYGAGTIVKLREDWYNLWYGRDNYGDEGWPLGRFSPQRWIIDKCGAAKGWAGNGIWNDESNGYMDISFWGIGSPKRQQRKDSLEKIFLTEHPNELAFADALSTPGTQFRFRYDPDQVVYTITNVKRNEVWNYETPQGVWGVEKEDPNNPGTFIMTGGSMLGNETEAPFGGVKTGPLAGAPAYISDLFSSEVEMTGGAPQNRRYRWTLTLDKIIGSEGVHGFHPLTNHVDEDGIANIERGRAIYNRDMTHVRSEKGGTPPGVEFYNLNSYWNSTNNSTAFPPVIVGDGDNSITGGVQPNQVDYDDSDNFYSRNPNAYIGLHERGLNDTEIQIVTPYKGEDRDIPMSNKPAIWETEPLEDVGLDIYYAASPTYPVNLVRYRHDFTSQHGPDDLDLHGANWYDYSLRGEEVVKVGSVVQIISAINNTSINPMVGEPVVCHVQGDVVWLTSTDITTGSAWNVDILGVIEKAFLQEGDKIRFVWQGEGSWYGVGRDDEYIEFEVEEALTSTCYRLKKETHSYKRGLGYFNCWSYGTGVESNRIRDDYNAVTIDKGVKASMPLATPYEEERRSSGLIFSGIYNSTSGVNNTNQFIQAEPITKDINPINGSIQKLFARDTDLVTFCENKVFRILAQKDALFSAGGNSQLTGTNKVLGQTTPFRGEFGISQNPESFASESYRIYFTDKNRGAVLRLSQDGLTPISDAGMKDWFKDNLRSATSLIGSHDDRDDQYNLTIETTDQDGLEKAYTVSYTESKRGWVSFKSFIHQGGISHKNIYYSAPSNKYGKENKEDPWGVNYTVPSIGRGEMWQHALDLIIKRPVVGSVNNSSTVIVDDGIGTIIAGMVVEGNGITIDTIVNSVICNGTSCNVILSNDCFLEDTNILTFTTARNSFYDNDDHYSMVKVLFNGAQGTVKRFKTLDYEGTQAKTLQELNNNYRLEGVNVGQIYYDNYPKKGWYVENIETDMQEGKVPEFIDKENKWFNYIRSFQDAGIHDNLDTGEFSLQGLGFSSTNTVYVTSYDCSGNGCYDPGTGNGAYSSWDDCLDDCGEIPISYNCINGICTRVFDGNGDYANLEDCGDGCGVITVTYDCDGQGGCYDPGTGFGGYSTLNACNIACNLIYGCIDPTSCNYDPLANTDDGSCTYNCWFCDGIGNCYEDAIGGGFTDVSACQSSCTVPPSWDCVDAGTGNANCVDPGTGQGTYQSISNCWNNCIGINESWDCDGQGNCSDPGTGLGIYTLLADCQSNCIIPTWNCDAGGCLDPGTGNGTYTSLAACKSACGIIDLLEWECILVGDSGSYNCTDVGIGNGSYNSYAECINAYCEDTNQWLCGIVRGAWDCENVGAGNGLYNSYQDCINAGCTE